MPNFYNQGGAPQSPKASAPKSLIEHLGIFAGNLKHKAQTMQQNPGAGLRQGERDLGSLADALNGVNEFVGKTVNSLEGSSGASVRRAVNKHFLKPSIAAVGGMDTTKKLVGNLAKPQFTDAMGRLVGAFTKIR